MKRIVKAALALIIVLAVTAVCAVTLFADSVSDGSDVLPRISDSAGLLTEDEKAYLEERISRFREEKDFEILFISTDEEVDVGDSDVLAEFFAGIGFDVELGYDAIALLIPQDREQWTLIMTGDARDIFGDDQLGGLGDEINPMLEEGNYAGAVNTFVDRVTEMLGAPRTADGLPRVIDNAGLLDTDEAAKLEERIAGIREKYSFDVVILTENSIGSKTPAAYAEDYYDLNGFGEGAGHDGVLLLLNMGERDWMITATGYGESVFTDYGIQNAGEEIVGYLGEGDYYQAFDRFLDVTVEYIEAADAGEPVDDENFYDDYYNYYNDGYGSRSSSGHDYFLTGGVILIVSLIIAFAVTGGMKSKMRTVVPQRTAQNYVAGFDLRNQQDMFLYSNVARTLKSSDSGSGGGRSGGSSSSSHYGSSGTSHRSGGGKF